MTYPPRKLTGNSIFPFGEHKGKFFKDIEERYLEWLWEQDWFQEQGKFEDIKTYICDFKNRPDEPAHPINPLTTNPAREKAARIQTLAKLLVHLRKNDISIEMATLMVGRGIVEENNVSVMAKMPLFVILQIATAKI